MTLKYVAKDSGEVQLTTFLGKADKNESYFGDILFILTCGFLLLAYLAYFTVKKFRRNTEEKKIFEKIKKVAKKVDLQQVVQTNTADKEFLEGSGAAINQFTVSSRPPRSPSKPTMPMRRT